ncbi:MAG: RNA polymerase sigma factor [Planctomycetes bacterium]|nr:RNA polymerase sigma factor [Planctomycetota bacterium]
MLEDRRLLRRLKRGDKDALCRIYEKYDGDLVTLAAHLLHDPNSAEDVVQKVFISLARTAPVLCLRRTLRAYLATAVANRARDHYRQRSRARLAPIDEAGQVADGSDPDTWIDHIWFDTQTRLPVRIEQMGRPVTGDATRTFTIIMDQFVYDAQLPADTFLPPPEGFINAHPDDLRRQQ